MSHEYSIGKPHGGTGWLIRKDLYKKTKVDFISHRISACQRFYR